MPELDFDGIDFSAEDEADAALDDLLSAHRHDGVTSSGSSGSTAAVSGPSSDAGREHQEALDAALADRSSEAGHSSGSSADQLEEPALPLQDVADDRDEHEDLDDAEAADELAGDDGSGIVSEQKAAEQDANQAVTEALALEAEVAAGATELLPVTGFHVAGQGSSQMQVRAMPTAMSDALRQAIIDAAVGSGHRAAEAQLFASRLSQSALVTALLFARLEVSDLGLDDLDRSTAAAARFFRRTDPLQAALVAAFEKMSSREAIRDRRLNRLESNQREVIATTATIEHMQAFSMVDKQDNILRGTHTSMDIDVADDAVVGLRDRARHQVQTQVRREKDKAGRNR